MAAQHPTTVLCLAKIPSAPDLHGISPARTSVCLHLAGFSLNLSLGTIMPLIPELESDARQDVVREETTAGVKRA
jgi:hypothetical protein